MRAKGDSMTGRKPAVLALEKINFSIFD